MILTNCANTLRFANIVYYNEIVIDGVISECYPCSNSKIENTFFSFSFSFSIEKGLLIIGQSIPTSYDLIHWIAKQNGICWNMNLFSVMQLSSSSIFIVNNINNGYYYHRSLAPQYPASFHVWPTNPAIPNSFVHFIHPNSIQLSSSSSSMPNLSLPNPILSTRVKTYQIKILFYLKRK